MGHRITPTEKYFIPSERGFSAAVSQQDYIEAATGYPHDIREVCYNEDFERKDCNPNGDDTFVMHAGYMVEPIKIPDNCGIGARYDLFGMNWQLYWSEYGQFGQKYVNFVPAAECAYAMYRLAKDSCFVPVPEVTSASTEYATDYGVVLGIGVDRLLMGLELLNELTPWMHRKTNFYACPVVF